MDLYVFIDVSGSMNEMGKIHLQRNLCRYVSQLQSIDQEKYSGNKIYFYQWAQSISEIILQSDGDIPALKAESSSSLSELSDFLSKKFKNTEISKILILSDGNFLNSDLISFQRKLGTCTNLIIRTVAVGADANLLKLKKISSNKTVYLSENISSGVENIIFGSDESLAAPVSIAQILQSAPAEA